MWHLWCGHREENPPLIFILGVDTKVMKLRPFPCPKEHKMRRGLPGSGVPSNESTRNRVWSPMQIAIHDPVRISSLSRTPHPCLSPNPLLFCRLSLDPRAASNACQRCSCTGIGRWAKWELWRVTGPCSLPPYTPPGVSPFCPFLRTPSAVTTTTTSRQHLPNPNILRF